MVRGRRVQHAMQLLQVWSIELHTSSSPQWMAAEPQTDRTDALDTLALRWGAVRVSGAAAAVACTSMGSNSQLEGPAGSADLQFGSAALQHQALACSRLDEVSELLSVESHRVACLAGIVPGCSGAAHAAAPHALAHSCIPD